MEKAKVLLVAATLPEILPTILFFNLTPTATPNHYSNGSIAALITGIGMVNTAFYLGKFISHTTPKIAINAGIAGSFTPSFPIGTVVEIYEDTFSELGAEDPEDFLNMKEMGFPLLQKNEQTYYNTFQNPNPPRTSNPLATAITVNTVHGAEVSIQIVQKRWGKQVETMEGAAFFQAMIAEEIPFVALRAISNFVEPRNRTNWKIQEAVINLNKALIECIESQINANNYGE